MNGAIEFEQSRMRGIVGFFVRLLADAVDALAMLFDWLIGKFEWSPVRLLVALAIGLIYAVSPIDIIPDAIPFAGWIDDFVIATAVIRMARVDVNRWREWKSNGR